MVLFESISLWEGCAGPEMRIIAKVALRVS